MVRGSFVKMTSTFPVKSHFVSLLGATAHLAGGGKTFKTYAKRLRFHFFWARDLARLGTGPRKRQKVKTTHFFCRKMKRFHLFEDEISAILVKPNPMSFDSGKKICLGTNCVLDSFRKVPFSLRKTYLFGTPVTNPIERKNGTYKSDAIQRMTF